MESKGPACHRLKSPFKKRLDQLAALQLLVISWLTSLLRPPASGLSNA